MSFNISTEQQVAINYLNGPSLIIAGAGTGKTTVLTEKIKKIVLEKKVSPEQVLALTFTEKAAFEMEERVDKALPYGYYQTWVMTFHGFADTLLREHGLHIGLSPSYKILSEAESVLFLRNHLNELSLEYFFSTGNPIGFINHALKHFSRLRDENITPVQYLSFAKKQASQAKEEEEKQEAQKTLELAEMYQKYQALKLKHSFLDYADLIYYLVKLLTKRTNVLKSLQSQFQYGLVDEFQDTNIVQYDLIKLLFPPQNKPNLTVIGDDNQSIYKFRGASVSNILSFNSDYSQVKTFILNTNYRSYQAILDTSYRLITHNNPDTLEVSLGISKKLVSSRGHKKIAQPQLLHGTEGDQEAEAIAKTIIELGKTGNYQLNDFAILVRASDHAKPIIQALERMNLPYQFLGPTLLYYKNEVRDLIALLRFLQDSHDSTSLFRVLSMPLFGLDRSELVYLMAFGKRTSRSLIETLVILKQLYGGVTDPELQSLRSAVPFLKAKTRDRLLNLHNLLIDLLQKTPHQSALQILYAFLDKSGYLKVLSEIKSERDEERLHNITKFFSRLKKISGQFGEPSVNEVIEHIDLSLELGDTPRVEDFDYEKENAVNILTAHSAKGLEFKVVFICNLVADRFPTRRRSEILPIPTPLIKEQLPQGDFHLQEERRLFYVAITRARDRVYFTYADLYSGGKRQKKISPFVIEALDKDTIAKLVQQTRANKQQLSIFDLAKPQIPAIRAIKPEAYGITRFSYSQIETYDRCPKQYQYRYLLKVPEPESSALSFGSSVHQALEQFYKEVIKKQQPDLTVLLNHYQNSFIPLGYFNRQMQDRTFKHGKQLLTRYYQQFYTPKIQTVAVEQPFVLKLKEGKLEYEIAGKIDRIDHQGSQYEIIDYKTGKKPQASVLKKSLQLGIYALAAMDKNLLNLPIDKITLTYYYLEKTERFQTKAQEKDLTQTKKNVVASLMKLTDGNYQPSPGYHCDWCPFKIICPAWET
ncbi:hypothetical protein A2313_02085 [Candidatus Roizmanbacteria bacterium RIFOXYB2_FULL_41_10]|uniref:DNA 3'-5' helicase n=1 Tax=Candidatus Roizmanbacteria bacterium RIFOXYA1_FULL_41_12 TaxID=1802082 RepID=A0A1F7KA83_9BACT|nr:MAG: hypothetical protein A2209_00330 [Candidatus Roizmanbacteria bacterium RIFOXYA1_FULL_41_12]OGK67576.1 MAG: hypothetical protein A2377_01885 [Candidatus Roizmanbacteria bacterium RIFOXYB1_FULL_41_27]OGK68387.1 MAG: hypothetical protein A2262_00845 [Candidatus Roizmanbacteria bacterium RIFOXYA2_FULL_41_8]OGK70981.1 MAG: hypothetical protein A2313_02085 [Candidatus Roizmanbacteria bacterium RIFOXYB2_FULL_41_10]OGK71232.1 MAG: hypothetical protein A2403_00615 [Candidatus Roizmanbacteria bac